jgi:AraC family transcriptional regulator
MTSLMRSHLARSTNATFVKPRSLLVAEQQWRCPGSVSGKSPSEDASVLVSRWKHDAGEAVEFNNRASGSHHTVGLNLKCVSMTFAYAGRTLMDGRLTPGAIQVTAPGTDTRVVFRSPGDVLHLFITQEVLAECFEDAFGHHYAGDIVLDDPKIQLDPVIERLGQALAMSQTNDAVIGQVFTDSLSLAIVSRLVTRHFTAVQPHPQAIAPLPPWRLRRTIEYIDAHLSDEIGLADLARNSGLTRMHFAAQFRRATGLRPHEFLLRRRIEQAQTLLLTSQGNLMDVALSCGFRSQPHFTTVFKRFVGETPHRWRNVAIRL